MRFNMGWWDDEWCTIKCWTHLAQCQIFHFQFKNAFPAHTQDTHTWHNMKTVHRTSLDVGFVFTIYFFCISFCSGLMSMLNSCILFVCFCWFLKINCFGQRCQPSYVFNASRTRTKFLLLCAVFFHLLACWYSHCECTHTNKMSTEWPSCADFCHHRIAIA